MTLDDYLDAFNDQQLDLAELEAEEQPRQHCMVVDTKQEATALVRYLKEHGFTGCEYNLDSAWNNYDVTFTSDHKLTDAQIDKVEAQCPNCVARTFNIGDGE